MTPIEAAQAELLSRAELEDRGLSSRRIAAAVRSGVLRRVHRGWYVTADAWDAAYPERRHLLHVLAVHRSRHGGHAVFSLVSAAVLHGLPLFRLSPARVHLSGDDVDGHVSGSDVARHLAPVGENDRIEIHGVPCTSLARTVADMVRHAPAEAGISIADAALRAVAWRAADRSYDEEAAAALRERIAHRMERGARVRGIRRGRFVLSLADGRAQLPGESVSRLHLVRLGFAVPRLQVPIPGPRGRWYHVDFGLDDVNAWGEYDGEAKYLDASLRGTHSIEQTLRAEKEREDWIRATTDRRFPRWGKEAIVSASALGERLAAFHVHPPR